MSIETWGLMPKSQSDSETIEQAIERIVDEHNDDPESHLGEGQSLQSHKASQIIDHLARSIVADKLSGSELLFSTQFDYPSSFNVSGRTSFKFPGFKLYPLSGGSANRDGVLIVGEEKGFNYDFGKDMLFQFILYSECISGGYFRFQIDDGVFSTTEKNIGLVIDEGVAKFYLAKSDGTSKTYLEWSGYSQPVLYVVRIEYIASEETAYFYINGSLLGSIACPDVSNSEVFFARFEAWNDTTGQITTLISHFLFRLSL